MLSVGKLFAVAAILALVVGFVRWSQTGFYTITIKNRAYGLGSEYWVFSIAAIFAVLAAAYYWLPILISLDLGHSVSLLHFWLSAISARRVLGEVLGECAARSELSAHEAQSVGAALLKENAVRLYRL